MISIPVAVWTAFNALNCIFAAGKDQGTNKVGFAIALGTAALSCGLLSSGALVAWLGMEITLWILHMILVVLALAVRPPSYNNNDINTIAFGASIRLAIAMIVWLCV
jgi:hypothetical protein